MSSTKIEHGWKQWFKPSRLIPTTTILGAGIAIILSRIGIIQLTISDNIIIALLALLAIDALKERIDLLEKIKEKVYTRTAQALITRDDLPRPETQGANATEICVISPAMATLINIAPAFIEKKIRNGCKVRILLLNPNDEQALYAWRKLNKAAIIEYRIRDTLKTIEEIIKLNGMPANCQIRLSSVFIPFSMYAVDLSNNSGTMAIEYHCYKTAGDLRPHIFLTAKDDLIWFSHYKDQFELAWSDGINVDTQ